MKNNIKIYFKILILIVAIAIIALIMLINNKEVKSLNGLVMYQSEISSYNPLIRKLKKDKNISLSIDYLIDENDFNIDNVDIWKESRDRLYKKLSESDTDILLGFPYEYLSDTILNNQIMNLDDVIEKDIYNHIYKPIIDISKRIGNGNLYFLSPTFTTKFLLVNETILSKLNINNEKEVMTWDDFEELAEKIKRTMNNDDIIPISLGPSGKEGFFMDFELLTKTLEIPMKSDTGKIYGDERWNDIFYKFLNMYKKYGIQNETFEGELADDGKIALRIIYPNELTKLNNVNYDFNVYPIPVFENKDDTASIIPQNIAISNLSQNKNIAVETLNYILGEEYATYMINGNLFPEGEFVSYMSDSILESYKNKFKFFNTEYIYFGKKGYIKSEEFSLNEYSNFHEISRKIFLDILDNKISIEDGFDKMKSNLNK